MSTILEFITILVGIFTIIGSFAGLISFIWQFWPKEPRIGFTEIIKDIMFQLNPDSKILEAWIPIGFHNKGRAEGLIHISELIIIQSNYHDQFELKSYKIYDSEKKQNQSILNLKPNSFGIMFLNLELSVNDVDFSFQDEINLHFESFMKIWKTVSGADRFFKKLFNRRIHLISDSTDIIYSVTLSEYTFKEFYEENKIPVIGFSSEL